MRVHDDGRTLTVTDSPGCFWLFSALFALPGVLFVLGPLGLFTNAGEMSLGGRAAVVAMGLAAVATGVFIGVSSPGSVVALDRLEGEVRVSRLLAFRRTEERFPLSDLRVVEVRTETDSDGDSTYQVRLWFTGSREVAASRLWVHDREGIENAARAIRELIPRE